MVRVWPGSLIRHNTDNKLRDKGSAPAQLSTQQPDSNQPTEPHSHTPSSLQFNASFDGNRVLTKVMHRSIRLSLNAQAFCNRVFSYSKVIKLGLFAWIVYSVARLSSGLDMFMVACYVNQSELLCGVCSV